MIRAKIVGTGRAVPKKILTNADLEKLVETSDEWITDAHRHPGAPHRRRGRAVLRPLHAARPSAP